MKMIDADAHVEESIHTWEYLEPEFYPRRPIPVTDDFHHDRPEEVFRDRCDLPERLLQKILCDNAARLYAI